MDRARLKQLIQEFIVLAIDSIPVQYDGETKATTMTNVEILQVWAKEPECMLSPMFLGYCMGEGEDVNAFSPKTLHLSVVAMAEIAASDLEFDWMGDLDATSKPH
jgi:hypothetical protein